MAALLLKTCRAHVLRSRHQKLLFISISWRASPSLSRAAGVATLARAFTRARSDRRASHAAVRRASRGDTRAGQIRYATVIARLRSTWRRAWHHASASGG